jgi:hypothetical protein
VYSSDGYYVIGELRIGVAQVLRTYAFAFIYSAMAAVETWYFWGQLDMFNHPAPVALSLLAGYVCLLGLPFVALTWWRRKAFLAVCAPAPGSENA